MYDNGMDEDEMDDALWQMLEIEERERRRGGGPNKQEGCYIATCVYKSYDCPPVWTLRRFRDKVLGRTWYGRMFIKCYYAVSPVLVKYFGDKKWFQRFFKKFLDAMVFKLYEKNAKDAKDERRNL